MTESQQRLWHNNTLSNNCHSLTPTSTYSLHLTWSQRHIVSREARAQQTLQDGRLFETNRPQFWRFIYHVCSAARQTFQRSASLLLAIQYIYRLIDYHVSEWIFLWTPNVIVIWSFQWFTCESSSSSSSWLVSMLNSYIVMMVIDCKFNQYHDQI